jgi:hypothetical protein
MNFELNKNMGDWLTQLNGKTVSKIFQVDYNNDRHSDIYLPWLFFVIFTDLNKYLEIEGDFDGDHIKLSLNDISDLDKKLKDNDLSNELDLWRVYDTTLDDTLGKLIGQKIRFIEFGIDKDEFEINGTLIKGQKDVFNFVRFNCDSTCVTIFEATGLGVSDDSNVKLNFEETYDKYSTE